MCYPIEAAYLSHILEFWEQWSYQRLCHPIEAAHTGFWSHWPNQPACYPIEVKWFVTLFF
jgi:hypothetical protein